MHITDQVSHRWLWRHKPNNSLVLHQ